MCEKFLFFLYLFTQAVEYNYAVVDKRELVLMSTNRNFLEVFESHDCSGKKPVRRNSST